MSAVKVGQLHIVLIEFASSSSFSLVWRRQNAAAEWSSVQLLPENGQHPLPTNGRLGEKMKWGERHARSMDVFAV
ncbi:hypothetical protein [Bradyrhizobium sp.]|uniref:hypothetical protein n=1 Tax=Bradyrhizobium sp. TaxID=376 RepID=UPI002608F565|nr:hypothetical protein [Bradyrhizobium sp.]